MSDNEKQRTCRNPVYVLAAGGTGGHFFPALSLAKIIKNTGKTVYLCTDERAEKWSKIGVFDKVFVAALKNKSGSFTFFCSLLLAGLKYLFLFIKERPRVVIGFGGYPSAPPVFAAQLLGIPTVIHESNATLGKANAVLAKMASCVATGVPEVAGLPEDKSMFVGNPVREEINELYNVPYIPPALQEPFHILVIGGSQGAAVFSNIIPAAVKTLSKEEQRRLKIRQQTREELLDETDGNFRETLVNVQLAPFFSDMREALAWAHLVISRGGATSIAEALISGKPLIIVPLENTTSGDQVANAVLFAKKGCCLTTFGQNKPAEYIGNAIKQFMRDTAQLAKMSDAGRRLASTGAGLLLLEKIEALTKNT
jgi:UDP-N-acetylglucosamine--N-acetylmuramyl-(pentapeptide) pyrophosphoryl-undecaprenol N-acetylglucosamine transferase